MEVRAIGVDFPGRFLKWACRLACRPALRSFGISVPIPCPSHKEPRTSRQGAVKSPGQMSIQIDSASMPTSIHSGLLAGSPHRRITVDGTTPQFSFNKNTAGVEWVAIEADGHYLLLDTVKGTTSAVPEPSFYGFFALAMVGLLFGARKLRTRGCCRTKGSLSSSVLSLFREPANRSTAIASDHAVVPSVSPGAMLSRDQRERLAVPSHAVCGCASPSSSIIR
jgi:hypothetical protein